VKNQPTLRDIAARAGVTTMTVSRALRGSAQVSEAKREEIRRIAKEIGYQPDPQVSRLMSMLRTARQKRPDTVIGVVNLRHERGHHMRDAHLSVIYRGAEKRANELGFKLDEYWLADPEISLRRQEGILHARGIEGLLLLPFPEGLKTIDLDFSKFALSAIGRSQAAIACHRAAPNHFNTVSIALDHLRSMGFRKIGLTLFDGFNERTDGRYKAAFLSWFFDCDPENQVPPLFCPRWDGEAVKSWMERYKPEAVITHGSYIRGRMESIGYRAPRDYSFVNLNIIPDGDTSSGVDQNYGLIGAAAIDLLSGQLNHYERGLLQYPKTVVVNGFWRDGDSVKAPGGRGKKGR
jgi:DNA-binding LacI/PurR family transcriptional regulator